MCCGAMPAQRPLLCLTLLLACLAATQLGPAAAQAAATGGGPAQAVEDGDGGGGGGGGGGGAIPAQTAAPATIGRDYLLDLQPGVYNPSMAVYR
jgi:hypothetical protein